MKINFIADNTFLTLFFCFFITLLISKLIMEIQKHIDKKPFNYEYQFPPSVLERWKANYPLLNEQHFALAQKALLQFFEFIYYKNINSVNQNKQAAVMVSEIADQLWHEFILNTQDYSDFCEKTFGKYIHHKPNNKDVTYDWTDKEISLNMMHLYRHTRDNYYNSVKNTPLIFTIDEALHIPNGYKFDIKKIEEQNKKITDDEEEKNKNSSISCSSCSGCGD